MVDRDGLLSRCTGHTVPRVRIPPSPPSFALRPKTGLSYGWQAMEGAERRMPCVAPGVSRRAKQGCVLHLGKRPKTGLSYGWQAIEGAERRMPCVAQGGSRRAKQGCVLHLGQAPEDGLELRLAGH